MSATRETLDLLTDVVERYGSAFAYLVSHPDSKCCVIASADPASLTRPILFYRKDVGL